MSKITITPDTTLFHGTIEEFDSSKIRTGGYDDIFWTTDHSTVAQSYIPSSHGILSTSTDLLYAPGSRHAEQFGVKYTDIVKEGHRVTSYRVDCDYFNEIDAHSNELYNNLNTLKQEYQKLKEEVKVLQDRLRAENIKPSTDKEWDELTDKYFDVGDEFESAKEKYNTYNDRDLKNEFINKQLRDLGYKGENYHNSTNYNWKVKEDNGIILPANYKASGRLFVIKPKRDMNIFDISTGESDLTDLQYHKHKIFDELRKKGYDGVKIDDFAQHDVMGNVGHDSIGFFNDAIKDLDIKVINNAKHPDKLGREPSDEYKASLNESHSILEVGEPKSVKGARNVRKIKNQGTNTAYETFGKKFTTKLGNVVDLFFIPEPDDAYEVVFQVNNSYSDDATLTKLRDPEIFSGVIHYVNAIADRDAINTLHIVPHDGDGDITKVHNLEIGNLKDDIIDELNKFEQSLSDAVIEPSESLRKIYAKKNKEYNPLLGITRDINSLKRLFSDTIDPKMGANIDSIGYGLKLSPSIKNVEEPIKLASLLQEYGNILMSHREEGLEVNKNRRSNVYKQLLNRHMKQWNVKQDGKNVTLTRIKPLNESQSKFIKFVTQFREHDATLVESLINGYLLIESIDNVITLYRGLTSEHNIEHDLTTTDAPNGYSTWSDNKELARQYAGPDGFVYEITLPLSELGDEYIDQDGERCLFFNNGKPAGLNGIVGDEYLVYTDHELYDSMNIQT